jgi:hypothetical protein
MIGAVDIIVPVLFALLGIAFLAWIAVVIRELPQNAPGLWKLITKVTGPLFDAAPAQQEIKKSSFPLRVIVGRLFPIVFWLLIFLPFVIFPIILVLMPLLGIPWSYLLPPTP